MRRSPLLLALCFALIRISAVALGAADSGAGPVVLEDKGTQVVLSNGVVSFTVNKENATISNFTLRNGPNLAGRGAYFAVANSGGHDGWDVHHADFKVVRADAEIAEISMGAAIGGVYFTQHYFLRRGQPGFYVYVLEERRPGAAPEHTGQIRWSFYLNPSLFNYQMANDSEQGAIPDMRGSQSVQDATYRLKDGSVYTKYNYCDYLEDHHVHGLSGIGPGSFGAFIINASTEYLQAPTKQEITVHAGPIIHCFLASGHFEPRELSSPSIPEGWIKACGPWMVYANQGDSVAQIWADAKAEATRQIEQWPYAWMNDPNYPIHRGEVRGALRIYEGKRPASRALIVLTAPKPDWQTQVLDYIFSTRADAEGRFVLPHVRPGTYSLFAAVPGLTDQFRREQIVVTADGTTNLGPMLFVPRYYSARLWQIGEADLRSNGFKLSDERRQYGLNERVPADLTYTIGQSVPSKDWYYAQAKRGDWTVAFTVDKAWSGEGVITLGIAGQTSNPILEVRVNGAAVGSYQGGNSSALYRSAILGSSYHETKIIRFPASRLHTGANTVTLHLSRGSVMYDAVKLEIDDPNVPKTIPSPPL